MNQGIVVDLVNLFVENCKYETYVNKKTQTLQIILIMTAVKHENKQTFAIHKNLSVPLFC